MGIDKLADVWYSRSVKKKDERKSKHVSFDGVADRHWPTEARSPQFLG